MRMLDNYNRLEQFILRELEITQRELTETEQGLRELPESTTQAEELDRLHRYEEYLLDDLAHIRARREARVEDHGRIRIEVLTKLAKPSVTGRTRNHLTKQTIGEQRHHNCSLMINISSLIGASYWEFGSYLRRSPLPRSFA